MSQPAIISIKVNADTASAIQGFEKLVHSVEKLSGIGEFIQGVGAKLAAAFTIREIVSLTNEAITFDDEMGKMAERVGINVEELSKLAYAAKLANVGTGEFELGLKSFNKAISESSPLFQALGIDLKNADGSVRSTLEVFGDVAEKFSGFEAGANKSALAVELFGRAGTQLIPFLNGGKKAVQETGDELEKFGGVTTPAAAKAAQDFKDDLTRLEVVFHSLFRTFAENILPTLQRFTDYLKTAKMNTEGWVGPAEVLTVIFKGLATAVTLAATSFLNIGQAMGVVAAADLELLKGNFKIALQMVRDGATEMEARALRTKDAIVAMWASAKPPVAENTPEKNLKPAPSPNDVVNGPDKLAAAQIDGALKVQQALNQIEMDGLDARLQQQLISIGDYYAEKIALAQKDADEENKALLRQLEEADKLIKANAGDPTKLNEARAARQSVVDAITLSELKIRDTEQKLLADRVQAEKEAEQTISDARVTIAETTGEKLVAAELRITQQFKALRESLANSTDKNKPGEAQIAAAETAALNNAKLQIEIEAQERDIQNQLLALSEKRALVETDFTRTNAEKRPVLIGLLQQEKDLYDEQVAVLEKKLLIGTTQAEKDALQQRLDSLRQNQSQAGTNLNQEKGKADPNSFRDQFTNTFAQLRDQMGTFAQSMAMTFQNTFNSAIGSISNGIMGLINKTMNWKEALLNVGTTITTTLVQSLVTYAVRWIASQVLMATFGKSLAAISLAANAGIASASALVWAAPAALATIGSYGGAAAAAPFQIEAAKAMVIAQASAPGGFEKGGYTGDGPSNQAAGIVHRGEFVFPADVVKKMGGPSYFASFADGVKNARDWSGSVRVAAPITSGPNAARDLSASRGGPAGSSASNVTVQGHSVKIGFIGVTENDMKRYIEEELPDHVTKIVRGMKREFGAT